MSKCTQALRTETRIGSPTGISRSPIGGTVIQGNSGPVAGGTVIGENFSIHRHRSGGHRRGGLGDHRGWAYRGSGGKGKCIRPAGTCGIGSFEATIVGCTCTQIVKREGDGTGNMGCGKRNVCIPGSLSEVGVRGAVEDHYRRIGSTSVR